MASTALHSIDLDICALDEDARAFEAIASTDAIDGHDEVVEQDWALARYRRNPVVLFAHDSSALPIGRAENVSVRALPRDESRKALQLRIVLATAEANPLAEHVWQSVRQHTLRALSVGFRPGKIEAREHDDGVTRFHLRKNELYEISVVPVPANPETLACWRQRALDTMRESMAKTSPTEQALAPEPPAPAPAPEPPAPAPEPPAPDTDPAPALSAALERVAVLERHAAERDVDDAIREQRITPAERAEYLELRIAHGDLYARMIAKRQPLALDKPTVAAENGAGKTSADAGGAAKRIAAEAAQLARDSARRS